MSFWLDQMLIHSNTRITIKQTPDNGRGFNGSSLGVIVTSPEAVLNFPNPTRDGQRRSEIASRLPSHDFWAIGSVALTPRRVKQTETFA